MPVDWSKLKMARQNPDGSWPGDKAPGLTSPYAHLSGAIDNGGKFSWADTDAQLMACAIATVTNRGDAISFAVNRSRTIGTVTILAGPDRPIIPVRSVAEANALLRDLSK